MDRKPSRVGRIGWHIFLVALLNASVAQASQHAPAAGCLRGEPSRAALARFFAEYAEKPENRAALSRTVTDMLKEQLVPQGTARAPAERLIEALVPVLMSLTDSPEKFISSLTASLGSLCTTAMESAELSNPSIGAAQSAQLPSEAQATAATDPPAADGAQGESGDDAPDGKRSPLVPAEIAKAKNVEDALNMLESDARRAYKGEDGVDGRLVSLRDVGWYHGAMLDCVKDSDDNARPNDPCNKTAKQDGATPPQSATIAERVNEDACNGLIDQTAKCSRKIFDQIERRRALIQKQLDSAVALDSNATQTRQIQEWRDSAADIYKDAVADEAPREPFYGLFAGPSFALQDDGSWKEGLEVFGSWNTEIFDRNHCPGAKFCRGFFDVSFLTPDKFPHEVKDQNEMPVAVFDSKGTLRVRTGFQAHITSWLGFEAGAGLTAPIQDTRSNLRTEPRFHAGFHLETSYPDRAIGEVFVGYARDKAWERLIDGDGDLSTTADQRTEHRYDRLLLEGTMIFPRVELGGFVAAARLSVDAPLSGNQQADVRASILLYYALNKWLDKYRPTVKAEETSTQ